MTESERAIYEHSMQQYTKVNPDWSEEHSFLVMHLPEVEDYVGQLRDELAKAGSAAKNIRDELESQEKRAAEMRSRIAELRLMMKGHVLCVDCGKEFHKDDTFEWSRGRICEDCYSERPSTRARWSPYD